MTTSKFVCIFSILGLALITGSSLVCVHGKRQQPSPDEIERIINDTHSVIWECSNTECHPGSGLNVQCGSSISIDTPIKCVLCVKGVNHSSTQDYSMCKTCRNCSKHENKTGECTPEQDTTVCLGTCHKGFYMDNITGDCHPCSDCCNNVTAKKHHEKQCEDSGRPPNQQCRKTNTTCPHPTKPMTPQGSQGASKIALIIIGILLLFFIVFLVLWKCYGWEQVKSFLTKCCCCQPTEGNTINFHVSDQSLEGDLEAARCNVSGSQLTENGDVPTNLSSPPGAKTVTRKPMFQRLHSVPVKTQSKPAIPRSFSHPGALKDLAKFEKLKEFNFKSSFKRPGAKKHTKKGYAPVPTKLPEIDDLPVENHGNYDSKPASSGAVLGNSRQSAGCMDKDPGKEKLEKRSATEITVTDQCTSTTELHLSNTNKFSDIEDFLNWLLSKRMSAIPIKVSRKICMNLDTPRELLWDDYRSLAEEVGLEPDVISWLGHQKNKTELILQKFDTQEDPSIRHFKAILEKMERNDLVSVIEDWALYEWNKQNSNSSLL